jgi:hypothetical protein
LSTTATAPLTHFSKAIEYTISIDSRHLNSDGLLYPDLNATVHKSENQDKYLRAHVINVQSQLKYLQGALSMQMQCIPDGYTRTRREED